MSTQIFFQLQMQFKSYHLSKPTTTIWCYEMMLKLDIFPLQPQAGGNRSTELDQTLKWKEKTPNQWFIITSKLQRDFSQLMSFRSRTRLQKNHSHNRQNPQYNSQYLSLQSWKITYYSNSRSCLVSVYLSFIILLFF